MLAHAVLFGSRLAGTVWAMVRRVLWSVLFSVVTTVAAIAARRVATSVWRIATGEDPPA
jgi:hypothetical protein